MLKVCETFIVNNTLKAASYDWRKAPSEHTEYFDKLKKMTEEMFEKFNKKVVFVAHSMGNPTLTNFFNLQSAAWKAWALILFLINFISFFL